MSLRVVRCTQDAVDLITWLGERRDVLAMDTETTGLDYYEPNFKVRLFQLGDANAAWVVPFEQWQGLVAEVVEKYRGQWAVHNLEYDSAALAAHGIKWPWDRTDDTMIAMRLSEPTMSAGLKQAAVRHVSAGAGGGQVDLHKAMKANGWDWDTVPVDFHPYVLYAAMDTVLTARLWATPAGQRGLSSPVYGLEMETLAVCSRMADRGLRIDRAYCLEQAEKYRSEQYEILEQAKLIDAPITNNTALARWFMDHGEMITESTNGGFPSVAKSQLDKFVGNLDETGDAAKMTLRYRKCDKLAGSYLEPFLEISDTDGLMHADIQTLAAKTGRMSIRRPGLQTLPKPGDDFDSRVVRRAVIPRRDGDKLISVDMDQIEMRMIGIISQDDKLLDAFRVADATGGDFFAEVGKILYRDPDFDKTDPRRKKVKNTMYGMAYGAGPAKLALTAKIPEEEARIVRTSILTSFPGLQRAMGSFEREAREYGSIKTIMGRELTVDPELAYKGLNAAIQGGAADLFKTALVRCANAFEEFLVIPVHDEIVLSVPEDLVDDVRRECEANMLVDNLEIPITASASPGLDRWGDDE